MAQDSKKVRKERRLRRNLSLALQIAKDALQERDQARMFAKALSKELEMRVQKDNPDFTIKKVDEVEQSANNGELVEQDNQANRQDENGNGLEVPEGEVLGLRVSGEGPIDEGNQP